jgi:hypothetical protein
MKNVKSKGYGGSKKCYALRFPSRAVSCDKCTPVTVEYFLFLTTAWHTLGFTQFPFWRLLMVVARSCSIPFPAEGKKAWNFTVTVPCGFTWQSQLYYLHLFRSVAIEPKTSRRRVSVTYSRPQVTKPRSRRAEHRIIKKGRVYRCST